MRNNYDQPPSAESFERIRDRVSSEDPFGGGEINVIAVFQALLRHRWKIVLILTAALALAWWYLSTRQPLYTARAEIILEEAKAPIDLGMALTPSGVIDKAMQTEVQVIRSRAILRDVIDQLDLLSDPEFNPTIAPPPAPIWERWLIDRGWWPLEIEPGWPPHISIGEPPAPITLRADEEILRGALDYLQDKTSVSALRGTTIIAINVETWTPQKAALIANAIAETYIRARVEVKVEAQRFASQFIGEQIIELREEVGAAEASVQAFRAENVVVTDVGSDVARYEELKNRAEGARTLARDLSARLRRFEEALNSDDGLRAAARALDDRRINALLTAGYEEEIRSKIEEAADLLRADQRVAERRAEALEQSLTNMEASLEAGAANLVRLRQLEREAEASRQLFETFLNRQKETAVQKDLATPDARVLTEADPPYLPSYPKRFLIYGIAALIGLGLSAALIYILEGARNRFVTVEELEAWSKLAVLGSIPRFEKSRKRNEVLDHVRQSPGSSIAEAVRNLRTSILLANVDDPPKVVTLTSSIPEEGKSMTATLLATVSAQMGKRALLIDADLRRRTLHNTFGVNPEPGMIAVLNHTATLDEAIRRDEASGLYALPVEKNRTSAPDLLSSQAFAEMLAEVRERFDLVIIDAPPVLPVTDARILAKMSDALVYVVKWDDTPREILKHGLASLQGIGVHISGLVMTQVDRKKQRRYGYGYYGYYGYGSYKYYRKADRYYTD